MSITTMGDKTQAFDIFQTPLSSHYPLPLINNFLSLWQEKFQMSKTDFVACPRWKQIDMKKDVGLF